MKRLFKLFVLILVILALVIIVREIYKRYQTPSPAPLIYKPEKTIKILEGWTNQEIGQYLEQAGLGTSEEFSQTARRAPKEFSFLQDKPPTADLEGYLFPDTYRVYATSTLNEVLVKLLDNFDQKLSPALRLEIKAQGKTIYEIITMASIIEKEAPFDYQTNDDRAARLISGIFWGRLKIGQALQSDATLSYIFNDKNPQHRGSELEVDSPYNTYKYRGLPPGPICNPSLWAIKAAIYPLASNYNYFLTTLDGSQVIYAKTYDEHRQNKYKYLK